MIIIFFIIIIIIIIMNTFNEIGAKSAKQVRVNVSVCVSFPFLFLLSY